jgi:hypothetical protein
MLHGIEDNQDEVACAAHSDNLPTATLAILGTLDDTGKIEELNLGAVVNDNT